ncbi:MAG: TOBE domain-containing protein, partial [Betaproteobacteria bacterium]|nr:TOBE domain-containing protein [Betaproteobacteria bacterium]
EPLSNLDAELRVRMRYEFARLHEQLQTTMIYVTHDQVEAMTLADRIVVLSAGRIEQVGTPLELYDHPDNLFVAGFIGSPRMNFLPVQCVSAAADHAVVALADGTRLRCAVDATGVQPGAALTLGLRPEHFALGAADNLLNVQVAFVESLGSTTHAYCTLGGHDDTLTCELRGQPAPRNGQALRLGVPAERCYLFDATGRALRRLSGDVSKG